MPFRTREPQDWSAVGFTLVEVMVSLVIMLMVVTVAFAGFRIGLNAWERGNRAVDEMDRRNSVERLIRRQLAVAVPMELKIGKDSVVMFRGNSQHLEFISDYSFVDGPGDFRKVDYAGQDGRFLYGEKVLFGYVPQELEPLPDTQVAAFKQISFEFLGSDQHGPAWVTEWKTGQGIPPAVRIHLDSDTFTVRMVNR
jgi:prepilin-type N-terminal cleavage/methylation domain-containing protein